MCKEILDDIPEFLTVKRERVRSKSEKIIADTFFQRGIPYRYEYPIKIKGMGTIHPDFFLLNKRTRKEYVYEHFGMMSDVGYVNQANKKINIYSKAGLIYGKNFIYTMESQEVPLSMATLDALINEYLV